MTNEEAHRLAREKGVSRPLYAFVRALVAPFLRIWFRMHVSGAEHIPKSGAAIIAPNHKSFWDSFFIAVCTRRHVRYMAKTELIEARYGRLLVRLGAFPVRRGRSDADALETARVVLEQGGLLALFPEGTRIRDPEELGHPKRGAGRPWSTQSRRKAAANSLLVGSGTLTPSAARSARTPRRPGF